MRIKSTEKFNETEFRKLFKAMEKSIDYKNEIPDEPIESTEKNESTIKDEIKPLDESKNESDIITAESTEPSLEQPIIENSPSIFDDIQNETKEDKNIGEQLEDLADDFNETGKDDFNADNTSNEALKIKAQTQVELIDTGFSILFCIVTWEFSQENFLKWRLHPERKKALVKNMFQVLCLERKKTNPKKDLMWLIVGSYVPLLIIAVSVMFTKLRQKKNEAEQKKKELQAQKLIKINDSDNKIIPIQPENKIEKQNPINVAGDIKKYNSGTKSEKRGRHKNSCAFYKGKSCNCK